MKALLHPDAVEFGMMECCAMQRASIQEIHQPFIQEYLAGVAKIHPSCKASVFLGIFQHTLHLVFIPTDAHRTLYAELAAAEKVTFEKSEDQMLECGHLTTEHLGALGAVWVKMRPWQEVH